MEAKPLKADGSIKLNGPSGDLPTQMSEEWIKYATSRLGNGTAEQRATADIIKSVMNNGKVVKIVTGVNSNGITAVKIE